VLWCRTSRYKTSPRGPGLHAREPNRHGRTRDMARASVERSAIPPRSITRGVWPGQTGARGFIVD
jgi:hypothetical protein